MTVTLSEYKCSCSSLKRVPHKLSTCGSAFTNLSAVHLVCHLVGSNSELGVVNVCSPVPRKSNGTYYLNTSTKADIIISFYKCINKAKSVLTIH